MKGKLERTASKEEAKGAAEEDDDKYREIDASLQRLQRRLDEGGAALDAGERGANRVAAIAEELIKEDEEMAAAAAAAATDQPPLQKKKSSFVLPKSGGSETCHFCGKRVYVVERMSAEGRFFHRSCFRCDYCNILLRLGSYVFHREGPFIGEK